MSAKKYSSGYTKKQLYKLAQERRIPNRSKMSRTQLLHALGLDNEKPTEPAQEKKEEAGAAKEAESDRRVPDEPAAGTSGPPSSVSVPREEAPEGAAYVPRGVPLPESYGDDKVSLFVCDPTWLFCYWALEGGGCQKAIDRYGREAVVDSRWVLRMRSSRRGEYDMDVDPGSRRWYVRAEPETRYWARIGMILPEGQFVEIAASEKIETPPDRISDRVDEAWLLVRERLEKLVAAMGGGRTGVPASFVEGARKLQEITSVSFGHSSGTGPAAGPQSDK